MKGLDELLPNGCIMMSYRGSFSHGTYLHGTGVDDVDLMGIYVESPDFYYGLAHKTFGFGGWKSDTQEYWVNEYDIVNYEIRKLFGLLLKSNPNVLMLLYLNPRHIIWKDPLWDKIVENRDIFVSTVAYHSFGGYASDQLRKLKISTAVTDNEEVESIEKELQKRKYNQHPRNFKYIKDTTNELRAKLNTLNKTQGYMGEKRRKLVQEYGYDTKNAAHMIRILKMGVEFLKRGNLTVDRTNVDAEEIKEIKRGEWALEDIITEGQVWEQELDYWFEKTKLPEKPDYKAANNLCTEIVQGYYERMKNAR